MIIKVPEFGTDISAKQADRQGESPIAGEVLQIIKALNWANPFFKYCQIVLQQWIDSKKKLTLGEK